jgi:hypothetical protein
MDNILDRKGLLVVMRYKKNTTPSQKVTVARKLHGYRDLSQHMKYSYERKGSLSDVPHIVVSPGVYIIRPEDRAAFRGISKYAKLVVREVVLTKSDVKVLYEE